MSEDKLAALGIFLLWIAIVACLFRVAACSENSRAELLLHYEQHHGMETP